MNSNLKSISTLFFVSVLLGTGCKKDDPIPGYRPGYDYATPATYSFTNDAGESTVSFNGQVQRLAMLSEMVTYMKTANTLGTAISTDTLKGMYANTYTSWADAAGLGLTGSSKQLKSKTAAGDASAQGMFEDYMDSIAKYSALNYSNTAEAYGNAGVWTNGIKNYLQSDKGIEYGQLIEKGLMCTVFMNQITDNYLGTVADDENTTTKDGESYTEMQHHWDEAYGYFTSEVDYPANGTDRFWGKYANGREAILGSATKLATAFRKGRAAIDHADYTIRDEQIEIIRNEMEKVCAGTAIHYLNGAKANMTNPTILNHELSEAVAFINGLRYGYNSIKGISISSTEVSTALDHLGSDFNAITLDNLNNAIDLIASKTGLKSVKSSL